MHLVDGPVEIGVRHGQDGQPLARIDATFGGLCEQRLKGGEKIGVGFQVVCTDGGIVGSTVRLPAVCRS